MKGFRSTGIMFVVVVALAAYTFYEFKNATEDAEYEKGDRRIFHLLRDQIAEIELIGVGQMVKIQRENEGWKLVQPVEDKADSSAVEGFLYSLLTQKGKVFRSSEEKDTKWSEYGLDPVTRKVEIRGSGKSEVLSVSSKNAYDGSFYIRVGDDLLLGDRGLAQLIERDPSSFRSRQIYRGPEDVDRIEVLSDIEGARESYAFQKQPDKDKNHWIMAPEPGFPLDSEKVTVWSQKVSGLMASEFAAESPNAADLAQFLLTKPSYQVVLGGWRLKFGQDKADDVFVTNDKRPTVYKFPVTALDAVRVPKFYFRDGKAPFKVPVERVREVEIRDPKLTNTFVKKDDQWELKTPDKESEIDSSKLADLIQKIQALEAREYVRKGNGLPKAPQIVLRGDQGKVLMTLRWGGEFKSKYGFNRGQSLRFVQLDGSQEIFAVAKDKLDVLIDSAIIKKKAETP